MSEVLSKFPLPLLMHDHDTFGTVADGHAGTDTPRPPALTVLFLPRFRMTQARTARPPSTVVRFLPPSPVCASYGMCSK